MSRFNLTSTSVHIV